MVAGWSARCHPFPPELQPGRSEKAAQGKGGDYQKYMSQHMDDFQKYMQGQGKSTQSGEDKIGHVVEQKLKKDEGKDAGSSEAHHGKKTASVILAEEASSPPAALLGAPLLLLVLGGMAAIYIERQRGLLRHTEPQQPEGYLQLESAYAGYAGVAAQPAAQPAQAPLPAAQSDAEQCVGQLAHIAVSGCSHATVGGCLAVPAHVAGVAQVVRVARPVPGLIELIKGNREGDAEAAVQGAEVNDMDEFGSTPLILAAQRDWAQVVAELLGCPGVDPNHQNLFGSTALICAAANGYISTLNELLKDERVDLEVATRLGQTALFKAVLFGHMNTTERLVEAGAQSEVTNKMGQTILDVAKDEHKEHVQRLLAQKTQDLRSPLDTHRDPGIVRGNFTANGQNHGRPTYRKDQQVNGLDVMLYYWDERDGPNFAGWFGPKVGGDQVWAYHPSRSAMTPPLRGWKVPYDGPVDDSFVIGAASTALVPSIQNPVPVTQAGTPTFPPTAPGAGSKFEAIEFPPAAPAIPVGAEAQRQHLQAQMRLQHEQQRAMQQQRAKQEEEVMHAQLNNCGFQMPKIREECERVVEQAKKRLEDGQRQKIIEEERKVRMLEQADTLLSDFNIKVAAAEEAAKMLSEKAEPLTVVDSVLELGDQVEESNQLVEEARKEVDERIKICHEYLQEYHLSMKVPDMPNHPQAAVVNSNLQKICERLRDATNNKDAIIVKCSNTHKKALKKKEAMAVMEEISAKFKQYDKNNDGFLSKAEEFGFKLGDAVALQLIKALQVGAKGVPFADFQRLKVRIGCLRERVKDEERKKKREIRDKELEHLKEQFKSELKSLDDTEELDQEVKKVEEAMGNIKVEATKTLGRGASKYCRCFLLAVVGTTTASAMATPAQIQLNRRLTRAETPAEILEVVQKDLQQFNLVNCTTALHRYAKAISQGGCGPHHDAGQERTPKPLGRLLQHLAEMVAKGKAVPAQNLANALWASWLLSWKFKE
eukprot:g29962.t1